MRVIFIVFISLASFKLSAATFLSRIEAIDYPEVMTEDILVFLSTGQVAKISLEKLSLLEQLKSSYLQNRWLMISLNQEREIEKIGPANSILKRMKNLSRPDASTVEYIPSVLRSLDWANKYFKESKINPKESQCFNRAHVWSYEWHSKHKFNSSKIFIFFTRKFIREHKFEWWFHIAPYVHVVVNNHIRERVMDMKYTTAPSSIGDWVKHFVKTAPGCTTVEKYSDYANFPENGNCYLMRASMYYYWPLDLEHEELHGTIKFSWLPEEINIAYQEAFDILKQ